MRPLGLTLSTAAAALALAPVAAFAVGVPERTEAVEIAVLGDTPYGEEQRRLFPALVDDVNATDRISLVLHAGDVKSGSTSCDDARLRDRAALYDTFADPFILTPGDNEWTDCHRVAAGQYVPTERLAAVREIFYPRPGWTSGGRELPILAQSQDPDRPENQEYVENVRFTRADAVFATVHVVGSDNGLAPWSGLPGGDRPEERTAEFADREAAALAWIDATFDTAERRDARGVAVMMQAEPVRTAGFARVRERLLARAEAFDGPVLLVHGDEHVYEVEREYGGVSNLTRLETFGATASRWLRLTVDPSDDDVFRWSPQAVG